MKSSKSRMPMSVYIGAVFIVCMNMSSAHEDYTDSGSHDQHSQFEIDMKLESDEIDITWALNSSLEIYGFRAIIYGEDNDIVYQSPILHKTASEMTFKQELEGGDNRVCMQVLGNATHVLQEKCQTVEMTDLKIVIGVLAGTVFLIPCLLGLFYILYKDYKLSKGEEYEELPEKEDNIDTTDENAATTRVKYILKPDTCTQTPKKVEQLTSHVNDSFVEDETAGDNTKTQSSGMPSTSNKTGNDQTDTTLEVVHQTQNTPSLLKSKQVLSLDVDTTIAMAAVCCEKSQSGIEITKSMENKSDIYTVKL